jgi:hypothetical protein
MLPGQGAGARPKVGHTPLTRDVSAERARLSAADASSWTGAVSDRDGYLAYFSAPMKCSDTYGSPPTTQLSCGTGGM